jgi:hypothetical protein
MEQMCEWHDRTALVTIRVTIYYTSQDAMLGFKTFRQQIYVLT